MSDVMKLLLQKEREYVAKYYDIRGMTDEEIDKKFDMICREKGFYKPYDESDG